MKKWDIRLKLRERDIRTERERGEPRIEGDRREREGGEGAAAAGS